MLLFDFLLLINDFLVENYTERKHVLLVWSLILYLAITDSNSQFGIKKHKIELLISS